MIDLPGYMSIKEATEASADETDKALGATVAILRQLAMEKAMLHSEKWGIEDEERISAIDERLKEIKSEESSWHRIESGLQSRLKVAGL